MFPFSILNNMYVSVFSFLTRSRSETPDKHGNAEKVESEDLGSERKIPIYGREEKKSLSSGKTILQFKIVSFLPILSYS